MTDIPAEKLAGYFLEWQRIEDEKAKLAERSKDLFKAMKDEGYDTKAARVCFREKKLELESTASDVAEAEEAEAVLDRYRSALTNGLASRAGRARESQSYAEAKGITVPAFVAITSDGSEYRFDPETGELTDTQEQPETAPSLNNGEDHDADSGQHVGQQDGEQRGSAPVSSADGRGEIADDGDQGQGAGASGTDRGGWPVAGTVDRQDEDGRSRHVGGEVDHEITPSDGGAFVAVKGKARLADADSVEPSPSDAVSPSVAPPADTVAEPQAPQAATVPHSNPQPAASLGNADSPASTSSPEPGSLSVNQKCQKHKRGEFCGFAYSQASCWRCNQAAAQQTEAA